MTAAPLPSTALLGEVTVQVAQTMLRTALTVQNAPDVSLPWAPKEPGHSPWQALSIQMQGEPSFSLRVAWQEEAGRKLGGKMFSCPAEEVDASMAQDAFGELLNVVAGQIKSQLGSDHALGLPEKVAVQAENTSPPASNTVQGVWLFGSFDGSAPAPQFCLAAAYA